VCLKNSTISFIGNKPQCRAGAKFPCPQKVLPTVAKQRKSTICATLRKNWFSAALAGRNLEIAMDQGQAAENDRAYGQPDEKSFSKFAHIK
jgi:hypothetical protein